MKKLEAQNEWQVVSTLYSSLQNASVHPAQRDLQSRICLTNMFGCLILLDWPDADCI